MYWGDAKFNRIEKANLDGTGRTLLLTESAFNDFHYAAFVFHAGNIFFTDWKNEYVYRL